MTEERNKDEFVLPGPEVIVFDEKMEKEEEEKSNKPNKCLLCLKASKLTLATIAGVLLGVVIGVVLKETVGTFSKRDIMYVNFLGDLFLRVLKALILPLIVSSLVSAIASLDVSLSGRIAARAIAYYLTTTFAAVVLGMVLVAAIQPGAGHSGESSGSSPILERNVTTVDTLLDLVRNMFAPNIVQACTAQFRTKLDAPPTNPEEEDLYKWDISEEEIKGMNIIGLVVVAAGIGVALAQLGDEAKTLANFFHSLTAVSMKITTWVITLSPLGILFLVTAKIMEMEDMGTVMSQLGWYFLTVVVGLLIQGFVVLPLLYVVLTKKSPITFIMNMSQAIATAFGTASRQIGVWVILQTIIHYSYKKMTNWHVWCGSRSILIRSASLPITIKCLEENNGVDPRVARFALPIGATINMDGTALYEAVAAIFIAQVREVDLSVGTYIAISITATAAAIGAAGIPQAGLVTMVMVLDTVGLPAQDVTLILAVDWLLDRFRTAVNVMGDAFGAGIVNHRSQKELQALPKDKIPDMPVH